MTIVDIVLCVGGGDYRTGFEILNDLANSLTIAEHKHPESGENSWDSIDFDEAIKIVLEEATELDIAVADDEGFDRVKAELVDTMVTGFRYLRKIKKGNKDG